MDRAEAGHRAPPAWRPAVLGGAAAGVAASPFAAPAGAGLALALAPIAAALIATRPGGSDPAPVATWAWLALVALTACAAGLVAGGERLRAIDAGALEGTAQGRVAATGFVTAVPRRARGEISVRLRTADGRLLIEAPEPVPDLPVGREVRAEGALRDPDAWEAGYLRTHGIRTVLEAERITLTGRRRGGLAGLADRVRDRAEAALERGMAEDEAALARGFVLGQDDRIDPATVDDFKRSGLAHLLAVSGQNVVLLGLLAIPLLAALDLSLRTRLVCILALIAIYVPVTGAGPSIQRAGVMGAAAIVAGLAGRPRSRWYALGVATVVTLAVNPRASADVGWQLSFAAVAGILLWAGPIRDLLLGIGRRPARTGGPTRRALAEGAALTIAATLATAPLMAHHFEALSLAALPANLLALPAVAPVMWLGMLVAMLGQVSAVPVEPLNALNSLLIAYIAWVAHALGSAGWAQARLALPLGGVAAAYAAMLLAGLTASGWGRRRGALGLRPARRLIPALAVLVALSALALWLGGGPADAPPAERPDLEVSVLDVGQGDAILFEPARADPVLVDGGPPGANLADQLDAEGVGRLGAVVLSHDALDHAGGLTEALPALPVDALVFATAGPETLAAARAAGARLVRVAAGRTIRSGALRLDVLWPPRELVARSPGGAQDAPDAEEQNARSVVALARWPGFSMLLSADAEAESVPIEPGPVDVLKVAHHGSEDAGLGRLLGTAVPRLGVIPVGEGNPYGHPTPATLDELERHGVPVLRTDLHGQIEIAVEDGGWTVRTGVD